MACGKTKQAYQPLDYGYPYNTMAGVPGSVNSEFYGVTANLVGQTKVNGENYLTDSLASSVLTRQLEKKQEASIAKFLPDRIHFSRSEHSGLRSYRREVPFNEVRQFYTFGNKPTTFMLCYDGLYEGNRIYASFNCRVQNDIIIIRRMIYGEAGRSNNTHGQSHQSVFVMEPQPSVYFEPEPQPVYVDRPRSTVYVESVQERPRSPVYVERVQERPRSPVYVERVQQRPPSTVYVDRPRSPVYTQRSSYAKSSSRPQSMVYVEETPVIEETGPFVLRRVSKVFPASKPLNKF